jgi:hypothetical protein
MPLERRNPRGYLADRLIDAVDRDTTAVELASVAFEAFWYRLLRPVARRAPRGPSEAERRR